MPLQVQRGHRSRISASEADMACGGLEHGQCRLCTTVTRNIQAGFQKGSVVPNMFLRLRRKSKGFSLKRCSERIWVVQSLR
jgi:hypothetical protein